METNLTMAGQLWSINDPQCGQVLQAQAPMIAEYWAQRASESERVAKAIEGITGAGGWMQGIAIHAPLFIAVFQHHLAPAIEARRAAMVEAQADDVPTPPANGEYPEGTTAVDEETGRVAVYRGGEWQPAEEAGTISYTDPGTRTTPRESGTPPVDRWGHGPHETGTPARDADSDAEPDSD